MFTGNELEVIQTALGYLNNDMDDFDINQLLAGPVGSHNELDCIRFIGDLINKVDNLTSSKPAVIPGPCKADTQGEKYKIHRAESVKLLNTKQCCILRRDLDPVEVNPATSGGYLKIDWTTPRRCIQPDRLDDCEFNMFVEVVESKEARLDGMIVCVNTIDFDFIS